MVFKVNMFTISAFVSGAVTTGIAAEQPSAISVTGAILGIGSIGLALYREWRSGKIEAIKESHKVEIQAKDDRYNFAVQARDAERAELARQLKESNAARDRELKESNEARQRDRDDFEKRIKDLTDEHNRRIAENKGRIADMEVRIKIIEADRDSKAAKLAEAYELHLIREGVLAPPDATEPGP